MVTFIQDLPEVSSGLTSGELKSLKPIWDEQRRRLNGSRSLVDFQERLTREWAIETGIIEKLYSIDRGTTRLLIEKGLTEALIPHGATDLPAGEVIAFLRDHKSVVDGLFDFVSGNRSLTVSYVKELHANLTRQQDTVEGIDKFGHSHRIPLIKGDWKKQPNNPTREDGSTHLYTPPEHVNSEMEQLIKWHGEHQVSDLGAEVEAAWLHHRFTQVHPFQDGNGRVARALASLVFLKAGWFPLVVTRDDRGAYIEALERADEGDLAPLVALFSDVQKKSFMKAIALSEDVLSEKGRLRDLVASAAQRLKARFEERNADYKAVFELGDVLASEIRQRLEDVRNDMALDLRGVLNAKDIRVDANNAQNDHWFKHQITSIAKYSHYFADVQAYRRWTRLQIRNPQDGSNGSLVVSIHSVGRDFIGLLAVSAFFENRAKQTEENVALAADPVPLNDAVFQLAYNESLEALQSRLRPWLERVILLGIEQWRQSL